MCSFHIKPVFQECLYRHSPTFVPNTFFKMCVRVECIKDVNVYVGSMFYAQKSLKDIKFLIF